MVIKRKIAALARQAHAKLLERGAKTTMAIICIAMVVAGALGFAGGCVFAMVLGKSGRNTQMYRFAGDMSLDFGIDISRYQFADLDLGSAIEAGGVQFVIMRATISTYENADASCERFYRIAKEKGIPRGVYTFLRADGDPVKEAEYFLRHVSGYIGDAILVVDYEEGLGAASLGPEKGVEHLKTVVTTIERETGVRPVIYCNYVHGYLGHNLAAHFPNHRFWVANYNEPAGSLLAGNIVMHQYSGRGSERSRAFYNGDLDLNTSSLTVEEWRALARKPGK